MSQVSTPSKHGRGHSKPLIVGDLNAPGRIRIGHLMTLYRLSHSSIYVHLKKGLLPKEDGTVAGHKFWLTSTIKSHLESNTAPHSLDPS
jgi:predicted DNA-binding transcriptional regulator AlpA